VRDFNGVEGKRGRRRDILIKYTIFVLNYKTLLSKKFVPFYKTHLVFSITLIISLPSYPCLFCIFFFNQQ